MSAGRGRVIILVIATMVTLGAILSCDFVIEPPTPTAPEAAPAPGEGGALPDWEALTLTPPASAPLASAFPLPADLFYLNGSGQLWRQPLAGGEGSAELVSRPDQTIQDFVISPGGGYYLYRTGDVLTAASLNGAGQYPVADRVEGPAGAFFGRTMAWSPDAARIAYATSGGFQVSIAPEWERFDVPETPPIDLAWSPDSRWLLIWRQDGTAVLYDITTAAARWAELAEINGYAWLDDGRLVFAPATGGLAILAPEDLTSRTFIVPPDYMVTLPAQRRDGALVFFLHQGSPTAPGFLYLADLRSGSYSPASGVPVETEGRSWTPDALRLIGVSAEQTVMLLDPLTGAAATFGAEGTPVHLDWGDLMPPEVIGMPLPADLYFLRPTGGVVGVWRLPDDGSSPESVIAAPTDVVDYDVAPDGLRIVLTTSDGAVHLGNTRGSQDLATVEAIPPGQPQPVFSPDGRALAYASGGIWLLDLATGETRLLLQDQADEGDPRQTITYRHPRWSPNGNWLLVDVGYYEGFDVALLPVLDENPEPILLEMFGATAEWTPSGQALLYSTGDVYADPGLSLVVPGESPIIDPLLSMPILEAQAPRGGRLWLLRTSLMGPSPWAPTVQVFSATAAGSDIRPESEAFTLEAPVFSPGATMLAGLKAATQDASENLVGRLAIFNIQTGEMVLIEGMDSAHALQWVEP
jgi:hypothetical protein